MIQNNGESMALPINSTAVSDSLTGREIAIIGYALNTPEPGGAEGFWAALLQERNLVSEFPQARARQLNSYFLNEQEQFDFLRGTYFDSISDFDASFFRMGFEEACLTDPYQRMFLTTAYDAVEHAGYGGKALSGTMTGVYAGFGDSPEYSAMLAQVLKHKVFDNADWKQHGVTGSIGALVAGRLAHFLNLKGSNLVMDTLCTSSLAAVHQACMALQHNNIEFAIAGGIKLELHPQNIERYKYGFENQEGLTKSFDEHADGYARSEGVGVVVLKRLDAALRDGDYVHAIIKGGAFQHNGTSLGITAPSFEGIEQTANAAWRDAEIDPETITFIEASGSAVKMADTMEVLGLSRAFRLHTRKSQFCALGSFKSFTGHPIQASGIIALIKGVLCLKYKTIPGTLHFETPNKIANWLGSPFYVKDRPDLWKTVTASTPLRCGINAVAMSGTTCHFILEEALPTEREIIEISGYLFVISAWTEESLRESIRRHIDHLSEHEAMELYDYCYTLQTGRGHYDYRLAIMFKTRDELLAALESLERNGLEEIKDSLVLYKHIGISSVELPVASYKQKLRQRTNQLSEQSLELIEGQFKDRTDSYNTFLNQLAQLYIEGADVPWLSMYSRKAGLKLPLPTYAYNSLNCWYDELLNIDTGKKSAMVPKEVSFISKKGSALLSLTEKSVKSIWEKALNQTDLHPDVPLFDMGADSLVVFKIWSDLQQSFMIPINLEQLMCSPTIVQIATVIDEILKQHPDGNKSTGTRLIQKAPERTHYPLSFNQLRLFVIDQLDGVGTSYNLPAAYEWLEDLDIERLNASVQQLVEIHSILRTGFVFNAEGPCQHIVDNLEMKLERYSENKHNSLLNIMERFVRPFDLSRPPLFRIGIIERLGENPILIFDMHHIITDRASIYLFLKELSGLYMNVPRKTHIELHYKDYAVWEGEYAETDSFKKQERYWKKQYASPVPELRFPIDFPRPERQVFEGAKIVSLLSDKVTSNIFSAAKRYGITPFVLGLSAYFMLLHKYTNNEDIVVGTQVFGRTAPGTELMFGMFANTLAIRNTLHSTDKISNFIATTREKCYKAYANQNYPLHRLLELIPSVYNRHQNPLFDTCFTYINRTNAEPDLFNLPIREIDFFQSPALFDLSLNMYDRTEGLEIELAYSTSIFKPETIQQLLDHFEEILVQVCLELNEATVYDIQLSMEVEKGQPMLQIDEFEF